MNKKQNFSSHGDLLIGSGVLIGSSMPQPSLTSKQKAIVLGNILGDGHLQISPNGKKARLRFTHSVQQMDYGMWEYNQLKDPLCQSRQKYVKQPYLAETKLSYQDFIAYTAYKEELVEYHKTFYKSTGQKGIRSNFVKKIPKDLSNELKNPISLMVWYLDDGTLRSKADGGGCRLATQCYSLEEHGILQDCLNMNFGVKSQINNWAYSKAGQRTYGLDIPAKNGNAAYFLSLFKNEVLREIPSMEYKVRVK